MKSLPTSALLVRVGKFLRVLKRYLPVLMFIVFALVYAYVILKINTLSTVDLNSGTVSEKVKASPTPHIDAEAIKQLETLQDNSVNVQTLFEQSRTNPFEE